MNTQKIFHVWKSNLAGNFYVNINSKKNLTGCNEAYTHRNETAFVALS
jgi:hypothetical protein